MSDFIAHPEVLRWLALLVAGLLLLAFALFAARLSVKQWRDLRAFWAQYRPTFVEETDEPSDPTIVVLDRLMDKLLKADWGPFWVTLLGAVRHGLDLAFKEDAPPREVNLTETEK